MSIEFKDAGAPTLPQRKVIYIDGVERGEVKPNIYSDRLSWHACINLNIGACFLVQGHGPTPAAAVAAGIIAARGDRDGYIKKLAELESALGTAGKTEDEIRTLTL